jgi:hypothetical protein
VTACTLVRENRARLPSASVKELYRLSLGTPAEADARSAYSRGLTLPVLGGTGAAALLSGLILGFATDSATQPEARNAGYGLAAGAIALGGISLILTYTIPPLALRARKTLEVFSDRCQE